jgi:predicted transcriptional regulator
MSTIEKQSEIQRMVKGVFDDDILTIVQKLLAKYTFDEHEIWNDLSDEEKAAIEEGIQQLDAGKGIRHNEVVAMFRAGN